MAALRGAAAAALVVLALAGPAKAETPLPSAAFAPSQALFGDRVGATVTVEVDRSAASGVRAVADFGPLEVLAGPVRVREDEGGGRILLRFRWEVACLSEDCVPVASSRRIVLPPVRLSGAGATRVPWPVLTIVSRVTPKEAAAASPPFRLETQLPRPSYRVSPGRLALALDLLAAVVLLVSAVLVARLLVRRRRVREEERLAALSALEWALIYAREAERRDAGDRRKALGLLARVLGGRSAGLAGSATELAWAPQKPSPEQVAALVGDVEREVGSS